MQIPSPFSARQLAPAGLAFLLLVAMLLAVAGLRRSTSLSAGERPAAATAARAVAPRTPPPAIEPLVILEMTPDRARAINAAIPFARGAKPPARPFVFAGAAVDRERALTCLASAAWYEAGDDPVGQKAVVQVVLNRLRHPAYPKTLCGVVFQGSERRTGCQFTFTCDGAMARQPSAAGWTRARAVAVRALDGAVEKAVGTATHYHTDWVVPYWSGSLDKIADVHTHLFFRWKGWWGKPGAFTGRYAGGEVLDPRLFALSGPDGAGDALIDPAAPVLAGERPALAVPGVSARALKRNVVRLANADGTDFGVQLDPKAFPGDYAVLAYNLCKAKPACIVAGWIRAEQVPASLPVPIPALRTVSFLYRKNIELGREQFFWNCMQIPRENSAQCLPGTEQRAREATRD